MSTHPGSLVLETELKKILNDALKTTAIEEAFAGFILHSQEDEKNKILCCIEAFTNYWRTLSSDQHELAMDFYVSYLYKQKHTQRIKLLCDMLKSIAEKNVVPSKLVCEVLLRSPNLDYKNSELWCQTFQVIHRIIGSVDYKGCRDVLKTILERLETVPKTVNVSACKQLESAAKVVHYILDRNNCLSPSYIVVNEIKKLFPGDIPQGHWIHGDTLSNFVDSFRPTANMVSITARPSLLPVVGYSNIAGNSWKLDPQLLTFQLKGLLPFEKEQTMQQIDLVRYVLQQPYSRDVICSMLGLNKAQKKRCEILEEELVDLVVVAMERSEKEDGSQELTVASEMLWQHLSSQIIIFVLFQFASFPHMVKTLHQKLSGRNLRKGRDHLMWVLLQFIAGSIKKNPLSEFTPVPKLFDLLYPEQEPLPIPDFSQPSCTHRMAMACIWIHLSWKAQTENKTLQRPVPASLTKQLEFLQQASKSAQQLPLTDFRIALLCNAFSTNQELFSKPVSVLYASVYIVGKNTVPMPGSCVASVPTAPLPLNFLDSLTIHARMSLIHHISNKVVSHSRPNMAPNIGLSPALVETYSRLLVYIEIESLGIKGFISQILPKVCEHNAWGILHTMLELFSFRLHHVQPHFRVSLLTYLHTINKMTQSNHNQLFQCIESTALRIITGLGSAEVQPQLSRFLQDPKQLLSSDSEELNRALVLTLARAMHVTGSETLSGNWCKDILATLFSNTPHNWATHTLHCFPSALQQFFHDNQATAENRSFLKKTVEDEYRKWKGMTNDADIMTHFMQSQPPLFLCLVWKMLLDTERMRPVTIKILERIGPRALASHIRTFADFLVYEFSTSAGGQHVNKCIETLNDMVWKLNLVTLDRLVLSLALRSHEGNEAQVCFFIVQLLLLKPSEFRNRVNEFIKEAPSDHWTQSDWHNKHINYHRKFPEKFFYEGLLEQTGAKLSTPQHYLPIYFSNVCLRFLPVFDILIHRFLELPPVSKSLETLLDHLGGLYKFHDQPVTYLYNTLHYYEKRLRHAERPLLKRKLISAIIGAQKGIKPPGWCLSLAYLDYINRTGDDVTWEPEHEYYVKIIGRLVDTIAGKIPSPFPAMDWRFNEFPNPTAHALYVSCVELMALPGTGETVGNALLDVVLKSPAEVPHDDVMSWMNAVALVITALPECYWKVINDKILEVLSTDIPSVKTAFSGDHSLDRIFSVYNFSGSHASHTELMCSYVLALTHAVWHHSNIGQLTLLPPFLRDHVKPIVQTEEQFLYVCHLVGPFLHRFHLERTRCLLEIAVELYEMLQTVDQSSTQIVHADTISDFLYHIKYMFTGDSIKGDAERVIKGLRASLQKRLRFIAKGPEVTGAAPRLRRSSAHQGKKNKLILN
ncbi:mediator of RNA polymerase II transcription subunit 23-like [Amphiura filiformis]|uniref:mediator of RNA polymerase II transcription subunit 23-like n=1 Tax=Amphiura filiformis TaxID=82378 RepID=UPI003B217A60